MFDAIAETAGALAAGRRLEIVDVLAQSERSVEEVAAAIHQSVANTSHHLRFLARAGLVRSRRDGTRIYYRLAGPEVEELWAALRSAAAAERDDLERLAATYLGPLDRVEEVSRDALVGRLRAGAILIDVRPRAGYRAGHIPGARALPIEELDIARGELARDREIATYCRGSYCVFAPEAVRALHRSGYRACRLEDGFPEWRLAGLPVAVGDEPGPPLGATRRKGEARQHRSAPR